jgi:hypothetical protein
MRSALLSLTQVVLALGVGLAAACGGSTASPGTTDSGADGSLVEAGGADTGAIDSGGGDTGASGDGAVAMDTGESAPVDAGDDGAAKLACEAACVTSQPTAYKAFVLGQLNACGCMTAAPCFSDCTVECSDAGALMGNSMCGMCLQTQVATMPHPSCVTSGALACEGDPTCSPFLTCITAC